MLPKVILLLLSVAVVPCLMQSEGFNADIQNEPSELEDERQVHDNIDELSEWATKRNGDEELEQMLRDVNDRINGYPADDTEQQTRTVNKETNENVDEESDSNQDENDKMTRILNEDEDIRRMLTERYEDLSDREATTVTDNSIEETQSSEKRMNGNDIDSTENEKRVLPFPKVKLNNIVLNPTNIKASFLKNQVSSHLYGDKLEEREKVWTKMIELNKLIDKKNNRPLKNIEELRDVDGKIEGDIVLDKADVQQMINALKKTKNEKRKIYSKIGTKWSMPIKYKIGNSVNSNAVNAAIDIWERETCIRFKKIQIGVTIKGPHIIFSSDQSGCWSKVGKKADGQTINLASGCQTVPTIVHEIGHAIGFWHEQSRPDRDSYVNIHTNNIQSGKNHNFLMQSSTKTFGVPYDYSSIMHYSETSFAKSAGLKTITAKQPDFGRTLGQRNGMSFFDAKIANYRYCRIKCGLFKGLNWSKCKNGGYRNPNSCNKCKCQDGWTGQYCTTRGPHASSCGTSTRTAFSSTRTLSSPSNGDCSWKIQAANPGKKVILYFTSDFDIACRTRCEDYVEVRYKDLYKPGPRYCCNTTPRRTFKSTGRTMLINFRTSETNDGFTAKYYETS